MRTLGLISGQYLHERWQVITESSEQWGKYISKLGDMQILVAWLLELNLVQTALGIENNNILDGSLILL